MTTAAIQHRPLPTSLLVSAAAAGVSSALVNNAYFFLYRAVTGFQGAEPTFASVTASSLLPSLPAALGYFVLSRMTPQATRIFVALTAVIIVVSFEGLLRQTLPDGSPKPQGFDLLVMPMHVVVGLATALLIPRVSRWCSGGAI